jgi:hypothetical protein
VVHRSTDWGVTWSALPMMDGDFTGSMASRQSTQHPWHSARRGAVFSMPGLEWNPVPGCTGATTWASHGS